MSIYDDPKVNVESGKYIHEAIAIRLASVAVGARELVAVQALASSCISNPTWLRFPRAFRQKKTVGPVTESDVLAALIWPPNQSK